MRNQLLCLTMLCASYLCAQPRFQQSVNYQINVELDDHKHQLKGHIHITYTNNAPDTLREIWMHCWANAYKNRKTAFARQQLRNNNTRFHFAKTEDLGYFADLDFQVDGEKTQWAFDPKHPDIALIRLNRPLRPGESTVIQTPIQLKIPASFSRLGHVGTSYQMTQWYPKPAVYDHKGWHPMPYLDQGEFFSEFGTYDVSITLPRNYVVGATGALLNPEEYDFLEARIAETQYKLSMGIDPDTDPFPPSDTLKKTLRYKAEQVHDFAWFADKRFMVLRDTARLASGKRVDCWAMFTNAEAHLWQRGAFYVKRAIEFYSNAVGEYPWPHATAVHSALSAGGGMEYPMITVIGPSNSDMSLDEVITHEVGHNWFYGILASNERDHPFLDEGLNTYYERRYMKQYYGHDGMSEAMLPRQLYQPGKLGPLLHNVHTALAREHLDMPPDSPSEDFSQIGYGVLVYMKTALALEWLEQSVGTDVLDPAMQAYFEQWAFKHPYPEDLKDAWASAGLRADWFFDAMQSGKQADYALKQSTKNALTIRQKGDLAAPFPLVAVDRNGVSADSIWVPGFTGGTQRVQVPETDASWQIDPYYATLDVRRQNNQPAPIKAGILTPIQKPDARQLGILPGLGFNHYDKLQIGALFYSPPLPTDKFQYYIAPAIGLGSGELIGLADLRYRIYPGGLFKKVTFGLSGKSYNERYSDAFNRYTRFWRLVPQVRTELRTRNQDLRQYAQLRTLFIGVEQLRFSPIGTFEGTAFQNRHIQEIRYELEGRRKPNPFTGHATLESQRYAIDGSGKQHYLRGSLEWKQAFFYRRNKAFHLRAFTGYFLANTRRNAGTVSNDLARGSFALNPQGFNDYRYDQLFLARTDTRGLLSRQVSMTEGGFKNAFGSPYASLAGNSNDFIAAINLKSDLPGKLPIKPYLDLGYYRDASPLGSGLTFQDQFLWSSGLMIDIGGVIEVYFPLLNAKNLRNLYCDYSGGDPGKNRLFCGNYGQWISWGLNVQKLLPERLLETTIR